MIVGSRVVSACEVEWSSKAPSFWQAVGVGAKALADACAAAAARVTFSVMTNRRKIAKGGSITLR